MLDQQKLLHSKVGNLGQNDQHIVRDSTQGQFISDLAGFDHDGSTYLIANGSSGDRCFGVQPGSDDGMLVLSNYTGCISKVIQVQGHGAYMVKYFTNSDENQVKNEGQNLKSTKNRVYLQQM